MSTTIASRPVVAPKRRSARGRLIASAVVALLGVSGLLAWFGGHHPTARDTRPVSPHSTAPTSRTGGLAAQMDALAAALMLSLDPAAALPHPLDPDADLQAINVPRASTRTAGVDSGFARTPEGAVAQLAAIDAAALAGMNLAQVRNVYTAFAEPGSDPVDTWSVHRFVSQTLASAGTPDGSSRLDATYSVSEAQVKGILDDGDFVLACINGELDIWLGDDLTRIGAADCARMVWSQWGWRIGTGAQPAEPPNAWPGTTDAARAGWRPIVHAR